MSRATYIGGFNNGPINDDLRFAIAESFNVDDIDTFTFAQGMKLPDSVRKAAYNTLAISHSAGLMALEGSKPIELHAFNPPLPSSVLKLLIKTIPKTGGMLRRGISQHGLEGFRAATRYHSESGKELITHPYGNLRHLGRVANFDAIGFGAEMADSGPAVVMSWTDDDNYFTPTQDQLLAADSGDVEVVLIPGEHDELVLRPEAFLGRYSRSI